MKKQFLMVCALLAMGAGASENLFANGNFANGIKGMRFLKKGDFILHSVKDGVLAITGDDINQNSGYVSAISKLPKLDPGKKYLIEATITSNVAAAKNKDAKIMIRSIKGANTTIIYLGLDRIDLDTKVKRIYSAVCTIPATSESNELYIQSKNFTDTDTLLVENIRIVPFKTSEVQKDNLIRNGKFNDMLFDAWETFRGPIRFKYAYVTPGGEDGSNCLVLTGDQTQFKSTTITQRLPKLDPEKTYTLSVNVRTGLTDVADKKLGISIRSANDKGSTITYTGFSVNLRQKNWREYNFEFQIHPKSFSNQLYIAADGFVPGDMVMIDDVSITAVE